MKLSVVIFLLAGCALSLAVEHGPLLTALQPRDQAQPTGVSHVRDKRHLGLLGVGALGAGVIGAGALGLGAGIIGAKAVGAGLVGGALASGALYGHGRSYGGYGGYYGGGYRGYGGYGGYGYGGYGHGYRSYYPSSGYYVSDPWC
ncbi:hypothetical protein RR48_06192 [Papilio machaon]|uniref:Cuticular protein n=1 Tax=Papilio machaon TaxID=76193 RepID=A0A194QTR5_PAPMA|nr:hypothetical protein RR48_06192 [Papilio machaon]